MKKNHVFFAFLCVSIAITASTHPSFLIKPLGPEFLMMHGGISYDSRIAMNEQGQFLALFYDLFGGEVSMRGGQGTTLGPIFTMEPGARGANVAPASPGEFVVSWTQDSYVIPLGPSYNVMTRRFTSTGTEVSEATIVSDYPTDDFSSMTAVGVSSTDYWVVWEHLESGSADLRMSQTPKGGAPLASFQVNTWTTGTHYEPKIAVAETDEIMVVWKASSCAPGDPSGSCLRGRHIDLNGNPGPADFLVNSETEGSQSSPSVASSGSSFIVVWRSGQCDGFCIRARRFTYAGVPVAGDLRLDQIGSDSVSHPSVTATPDGSFIADWIRTDNNTSFIYARAFDSNGSPRTDEFKVSSSLSYAPYSTGIAQTPDGQFVVVWNNYDTMWGRALRLSPSLFEDGFESGDVSAWSDSSP